MWKRDKEVRIVLTDMSAAMVVRFFLVCILYGLSCLADVRFLLVGPRLL